ncbi:NUDIX hydrolase [Candidatus Saccharibacteria bacterium]|nr:NUDIX hydrolase [Candidatus Saccharibacteria bacterium]
MASRDPSVHAISLQTIHRVHVQKQPSTYAPPLPKAARDQLITTYAKLHGRSVHNSATLNLTDVQLQSGTLSLTVSVLDFFDFLMFTVFREPQQAVATQLTQYGYSDLAKTCMSLPAHYRALTSPIASLPQLVRAPELPTPLAVSVVVRTTDNFYLLVRRPMATAIGAGYMSVSATGGLEPEDLRSSNPITTCAARELQEELGITVPPEQLSLQFLAAGTTKLQPAILLQAAVPHSAQAIIRTAQQAIDYSHEVAEIIPVNKKLLQPMLQQYTFTELGKFHLGNLH